jgi:hypothetical protein
MRPSPRPHSVLTPAGCCPAVASRAAFRAGPLCNGVLPSLPAPQWCSALFAGSMRGRAGCGQPSARSTESWSIGAILAILRRRRGPRGLARQRRRLLRWLTRAEARGRNSPRTLHLQVSPNSSAPRHPGSLTPFTVKRNCRCELAPARAGRAYVCGAALHLLPWSGRRPISPVPFFSSNVGVVSQQ